MFLCFKFICVRSSDMFVPLFYFVVLFIFVNNVKKKGG